MTDPETPDSISLPALNLGPITYTIGYADQSLLPAQTIHVRSSEMVPISAKIKAQCLTLEGGFRVIVTDRSKVSRPDGVDAVLHVSDKETKWLSHRVREEALQVVETSGLSELARRAQITWQDSVRYVAEKPPGDKQEDMGLRPPQLGALFSVGSHWSLSDAPATIVMPTGTGKTETMLSVVAAHQLANVLVALPSKALRSQTARKFLTFGLLRELNVLDPAVTNPVVGVVMRRPKTEADLQLFKDCNVTLGIPASLVEGTAKPLITQVAEHVTSLIVDEAHHVAANTWRHLRDAFQNRRVLQFTATPYRNDNKLVDGTVIYSYPLGNAQADDYFAPIKFSPIYEPDDELADRAIAECAIQQLRDDIESDRDHLLMARCKGIERAERVHKIYEELASDLNPLLIHSDLTDSDERVERLLAREACIVVCVNMLGEGVDIPALKIAAVHDSHQSLAVLLQFVGRFARKTKDKEKLGEATVVGNIANTNVSSSLERLYSQDSDWNTVLRELSSDAAKEHAEFVEFLENSKIFETGDESDLSSVSPQSLRPTFSTLFYRATRFRPKKFHEGLSDSYSVVKVWINEESNTLYFVTHSNERVKWTRSKEIVSYQWDLFVLHYDEMNQLLYLSSTNKGSNFAGLAKAVGAGNQIFGEVMFRSLGNIGRLVFNNLGVTKHGRRNLSFAMYTGADIKEALGQTETQGSRKSNISGHGWEDGQHITIGCSYKGRTWSKNAGTIPHFNQWAQGVGAKLIDETIDTKAVVANVLIPEWTTRYPDYEVLSLDWPNELLSRAEDRVSLSGGHFELELHQIDLEFEELNDERNHLTFSVVADGGEEPIATFTIHPRGEAGYDVTQLAGPTLTLTVGKLEWLLPDYFKDYPPIIRFVDLSEVDGNILLKAENSGLVPIPEERLVPWQWPYTDITKESIWKGQDKREDSIQWRMATHYVEEDFSVVFDDDGAGEAADLVCLKEEDNHIRLVLVHCKFSGKPEEGKRIKDVVEVASQAVRSARRPGNFTRLMDHIGHRDKTRNLASGRKLFLVGTRAEISRLEKLHRFKQVKTEIIIVQPGVSKSKITEDQSIVLGAAVAFIKQTLGLDMDVICSD